MCWIVDKWVLHTVHAGLRRLGLALKIIVYFCVNAIQLHPLGSEANFLPEKAQEMKVYQTGYNRKVKLRYVIQRLKTRNK